MVRDLFHDAVKNSLIKDGWQITDDPFSLKVGDSELYIDLGAERLIATERNNEKNAVEIKSFIFIPTSLKYYPTFQQWKPTAPMVTEIFPDSHVCVYT